MSVKKNIGQKLWYSIVDKKKQETHISKLVSKSKNQNVEAKTKKKKHQSKDYQNSKKPKIQAFQSMRLVNRQSRDLWAKEISCMLRKII